MRTITKEVKLYKYDELSEKAQERVINDEVNSLIAEYNSFSGDEMWKDTIPPFVIKAMEECEQLQTPWFFANEIYREGKDEILKNMRELEYLENGEVYIEEE